MSQWKLTVPLFPQASHRKPRSRSFTAVAAELVTRQVDHDSRNIVRQVLQAFGVVRPQVFEDVHTVKGTLLIEWCCRESLCTLGNRTYPALGHSADCGNVIAADKAAPRDGRRLVVNGREVPASLCPESPVDCVYRGNAATKLTRIKRPCAMPMICL